MPKQCSDCPFRDPENQDFFDSLDRLIKHGLIKKIHACHMRTEEANPKDNSEVCVGHQRYLKKRQK